jgi:hypothetical protein
MITILVVILSFSSHSVQAMRKKAGALRVLSAIGLVAVAGFAG